MNSQNEEEKVAFVPTYLKDDYKKEISPATQPFQDIGFIFETNRRDVPWIITAMCLLVFTGSFYLAFQVRINTTGYGFFMEIFMEYLFMTVIAWTILAFQCCIRRGRANSCRFSIFKLMLLSLLDTIQFLLELIPYSMITPQTATIFQSFLIIFQMFNSFVFLDYRYNMYNYFAVIFTVFGVVVETWPKYEFDTNVCGISWWGYIIIIILSILHIVVESTSFTLKEYYLKKTNLGIIYMMAWTSFFSFFFRMIGFLFITIPGLPGFDNIPIRELGNYIKEGFVCWAGFPEKCQFMWIIFLIKIGFFFTHYVIFYFIFQKATASHAVIARYAGISLSNFVLLWNLIAGNKPSRRVFSFYDLISFFYFLIGGFVYFLGTLVVGDKKGTRKDKIVQLKKKICSCMYKGKNQKNGNYSYGKDIDDFMTTNPSETELDSKKEISSLRRFFNKLIPRKKTEEIKEFDIEYSVRE